ncbi:MAG: DUF86 domain-containing protein [Acidimicrobiales bacterium]|nr:DUF86 domain-containing protein [Acidimicrobiales bacterium]
MSRSDEKRLDDIRDMCAKVASLVARGRTAIEADEVLWLALERAIEIAGEAATQVSDETKASFPGVAWKELSGVRVVLAHAYHRVDLDQLWGIAANDLPTVAQALGPSPAEGDDR